MVNARRIDPLTNHYLPVREGRIHRREQIRQQLTRAETLIPPQLIADLDNVPGEIEVEETSFELLFAPLSLDPTNAPENHEYPPSELYSEEIILNNNNIEEIDSNGLNQVPTISINLLEIDGIIINPPGQNNETLDEILNLWENNAETSRDPIFTNPPETSPEISRASTPLWPRNQLPSYSSLTLQDVEEFERAFSQRENEPLFSDSEDTNMLPPEYINELILSIDGSIEESEE